jgi:diguanylate cyclase (GGDEF)-like protein/PAS domain S-box-containing protein
MFRSISHVAEQHDWRLLLLASAIGLLSGLVAIGLFGKANAAHPRRLVYIAAAGAIVSLAIVALYFSTMGAATVVPSSARAVDSFSLDSTSLASIASMFAMAVLGVALIAILYDHRLARRAATFDQAREALARQSDEQLRERNRQRDAALDNMSQALCMFDGDSRLIVCNARYAEVFDLPPELTKPGTPLLDILRWRVSHGMYPGDDGEAYLRSRLEIAGRNASFKGFTELRDGRIFSVSLEPMVGDGWVATHEDVTEQVRAQRALKDAQAFLVEATEKAERAAAEARVSHQRLLEASNLMAAGFVLLDAEDRFVLWNRRFEELFGSGQSAVVAGARFEDAIRASQVDAGPYGDRAQREAWLAERLARHQLPENTEEMQLSDGRWIRIDERRTADGGSIGVRVDVTDLKRREESFRLMFDGSPICMWVFDIETARFLAVNDAAVEHYGYRREEFLARTILEIRTPEDAAKVRRRLGTAVLDRQNGETWRHAKANGELIDVAIYSRPFTYEGRSAVLVAAIDITEQKRADARIAYLTTHDALTDLANRSAFDSHLGAALTTPQRDVALLCIDIDHFKEINDVHGPGVADKVLQALARRLERAAKDAFIARVGGDEFCIVIANQEQPAAALTIADSLLAASTIMTIGETRIKVSLSIGVAISPNDGVDAPTLLAHAEAALYRAKRAGRGVARFFEREMDKRLRERWILQNDLKEAVSGGQLQIHYQPQADISGEIFGFEALARWRHPARGMVPPSEFIPAAEASGAIHDIGEWILREACREAASWPNPLSVSVNLSALQLRQSDLVATIQRILMETGLPGRRLELEITESALIEDPASTLNILRRIKALSVKIAMDDFGTGYSSLSYLQSFPFDKIKIDRSFIVNIDGGPEGGAIVRAIIGLAHGLHVPVIAEGVETPEQRAYLREEGCEELQGFLIGRPEPIDNYARIIGRQDRPGLKVVA